MHFNSIEAYREAHADLGKRQKEIHRALCARGPLTDRQVKDWLYGFMSDMNTVRPRITELINAGFAEECGEEKDSVTGRRVRLVKGVTAAESVNATYQMSLGL